MRHGENGWIVEVEDVDGLVLWVVHVADAMPNELEPVLRAGRETAEANSYDALRPLALLLDGFVAMGGRTREIVGLSLARAARRPAGVRWARLLVSGRAKPACASSTGAISCPRPVSVPPGARRRPKLAGRWPNSPADFSLLYLGTTWLPRDLDPLLRIARRRGARIVVNQDGVAYEGWAGDRVEELNRPLREALFAADHILYQSEFSRRSASLYLGEPDRPSECCTTRWTCPGSRPPRPRPPAGRCSSSAATRPRSTGSSSRSARSRQ